MLSVAVRIGIAGDHNDVDDGPYSASAESKQHKDTCRGVARIEPVDTKASKDNTENKRNQPSVFFLLPDLTIIGILSGGLRLERLSAILTKSVVRPDRRPAIRAIVHFSYKLATVVIQVRASVPTCHPIKIIIIYEKAYALENIFLRSRGRGDLFPLPPFLSYNTDTFSGKRLSRSYKVL